MTRTSPDHGPVAGGAKPLVVAHRGSSFALPEHTIGAYLRAINEGADGLECDVRLTRDGHLVCIHDGRLNRVSDGTGRVSTHVLAQLDELDFGSWHPHPDGDAAAGVRTRVLTLNRLLDAAVSAGRPLRLFIETKHPTRYGAEVEDRLVAMLQHYGLDKPGDGSGVEVTVMSFSHLAVRRMHARAPLLDNVLLTEFLRPDLRDGRLPAGANIAGPAVRVVRANPAAVHAWHRRGRRVYVWTVNEPDDIDLMLELGVDAIISDRPRRVLDHIGR